MAAPKAAQPCDIRFRATTSQIPSLIIHSQAEARHFVTETLERYENCLEALHSGEGVYPSTGFRVLVRTSDKVSRQRIKQVYWVAEYVATSLLLGRGFTFTRCTCRWACLLPSRWHAILCERQNVCNILPHWHSSATCLSGALAAKGKVRNQHKTQQFSFLSMSAVGKVLLAICKVGTPLLIIR
jgi:hypothetical protein